MARQEMIEIVECEDGAENGRGHGKVFVKTIRVRALGLGSLLVRQTVHAGNMSATCEMSVK